MNLTIFQKMLIAPAAAMVLYCGYLYVIYSEHQQASVTIEAIRDGSLPVMELAGENIHLFEGLVTQMKDAVLAGEREWLEHTKAQKVKIEQNLLRIKHYEGVLSAEQVDHLSDDIDVYYRNAYALSLMLLEGKGDASTQNTLIENVERYHSEVMVELSELRDTVTQRAHTAVATTTNRLNSLLIMGVTIGMVIIVLVVAVTFVVSLTTRNRLSELVGRMKELAQGNPDFSKRLVQHTQDELAELIDWFNVLSDKLEQDYKKIEQLSVTDRLTQLYNRTKIEQLYDGLVKRAERYNEGFSVILLDLDHFKMVNDKYGHLVGDMVLQELSRLLKESVRDTDHVGRWGGEEFIIITPETDADSAWLLAEKVRQRIESYRFTEVGNKTGSFGVATYQAGDTSDTLTQRADDCLYKAKVQGRNCVVGEVKKLAVSSS